MDRIQGIVEQFRQGDYSGFPVFYEETHRKVYYISYGILGNEFDAKDAMQDTYVRFIQSLERFKAGTNPFAYLATIARNLCYDILDKRNREVGFREEIGDEETLAAGAPEIDGLYEVKRILAPLNDSEREIVVLHVLDDLKFREIAEITGKKLSTVLVTYNRAMKKLKRKEEDR